MQDQPAKPWYGYRYDCSPFRICAGSHSWTLWSWIPNLSLGKRIIDSFVVSPAELPMRERYCDNCDVRQTQLITNPIWPEARRY